MICKLPGGGIGPKIGQGHGCKQKTKSKALVPQKLIDTLWIFSCSLNEIENFGGWGEVSQHLYFI